MSKNDQVVLWLIGFYFGFMTALLLIVAGGGKLPLNT
jgi:hypothetical protein